MKMKPEPVITYTEILARAITSLENEIEEWHRKATGFPKEQREMMIAQATKEPVRKLEALKIIYSFETGANI